MESKNKLTMCRLCLCKNESFINIFELNGHVIAEVISRLLQFQVSKTDGYPHVVCFTCLKKLTEFKLFRESCIKSKITYDKLFFANESLEKDRPETTCGGPVGTEADKLHQEGHVEERNNPVDAEAEKYREGLMEKLCSILSKKVMKREEVVIYSSSDEASEDSSGEAKTEAKIMPVEVDICSSSDEAPEDPIKETKAKVSFGPILLKDKVLPSNGVSHPQEKFVDSEKSGNFGTAASTATLMDSLQTSSEPVTAEEDKSQEEGTAEASKGPGVADGNEFQESPMEAIIKPEEVDICSSSDEASEEPIKETEVSIGPILSKDKDNNEVGRLQEELIDSEPPGNLGTVASTDTLMDSLQEELIDSKRPRNSGEAESTPTSIDSFETSIKSEEVDIYSSSEELPDDPIKETENHLPDSPLQKNAPVVSFGPILLKYEVLPFHRNDDPQECSEPVCTEEDKTHEKDPIEASDDPADTDGNEVAMEESDLGGSGLELSEQDPLKDASSDEAGLDSSGLDLCVEDPLKETSSDEAGLGGLELSEQDPLREASCDEAGGDLKNLEEDPLREASSDEAGHDSNGLKLCERDPLRDASSDESSHAVSDVELSEKDPLGEASSEEAGDDGSDMELSEQDPLRLSSSEEVGKSDSGSEWHEEDSIDEASSNEDSFESEGAISVGDVEPPFVSTEDSTQDGARVGSAHRKAAGGSRGKFKCRHCHKVLSRRSGLTLHLATHGIGKFKCNVCDKAVVSKRALKNHARMHSGEYPHKCPKCASSFTHVHKLNAHMKAHKGSKPFPCMKCKLRYRRKSGLNKHMLTHSKPYRCETCHVNFGHKSSLKRHVRNHLRKGSFKCVECDMEFARDTDLQHHSLVHTGARFHTCVHCDKQFRFLSQLRRHLERVCERK